MSFINTVTYLILDLWNNLSSVVFLASFLPLLLLYELPLMAIVTVGIIHWYKRTYIDTPTNSLYKPSISCIITCYSEGDAVASTINSLVEQTYDGDIEIIAVIDGAVQNNHTYLAARRCQQQALPANRRIVILPKWQRGGRVSTLNAGLAQATGEIVINADADTSFDNNMVDQIVPNFEDPDVPAVGGALRVRNNQDSLLTRMQSIEYLISMQGGKTGLGNWNLINNISGAFGAFRREILIQIGGWDTHTAEDLDLTIRFKQYFKRKPNWRLPFATLAIGHTDAPSDLKTLVNQRLRWDGDLYFLYLRKHWPAFTPKLLGMKSFLFTLFYGVIQNVLLPILMVIYLVAVSITLPWEVIFTLSFVIYCIYLFFLVVYFSIVLVAISERPKQDRALIPWLLIYPIYSFLMRVLCAFAVINEILRRSHEESGMAPWWVLKRGRKF